MTQSRLNNVSICRVHRERLDNVNVNEIAKLFAAKTEIRKKLFNLESSNSFVNTNLVRKQLQAQLLETQNSVS